MENAIIKNPLVSGGFSTFFYSSGPHWSLLKLFGWKECGEAQFMIHWYCVSFGVTGGFSTFFYSGGPRWSFYKTIWLEIMWGGTIYDTLVLCKFQSNWGIQYLLWSTLVLFKTIWLEIMWGGTIYDTLVLCKSQSNLGIQYLLLLRWSTLVLF